MRLHTLLLFSLLALPTVAAADERILFAFEDANAAQGWQAVNDGVMGGRSDGRFRITDAGHLEFFGTLSLENNGGFASVRTNGRNLGLQADDAILLRVKGDGREYACNVYVGRNRYSYRQTFTTKKGEWLEVALPLDRFTATWRGRVFPNEQLDPSQITGIGFLLGDKKPGPFTLLVDSIRAGEPSPPASAVTCTGTYPHHLQGVCSDEESLYWSFTTTLVKTDKAGNVLKKIPVANHHGDLCLHDGRLFVAVNLGAFNDPQGNADSWVYVYDADTLDELARHETQEVFHGAGGIGVRNDHFFVVGGLPDGVDENYVYEYDDSFTFLTKHTIPSGHTHLGIQTAAFADDRWWFGCYGSPEILLVTDSDFSLLGRYEASCSLGVCGLGEGGLLVASGRCDAATGCSGTVRTARPDDDRGFTL